MDDYIRRKIAYYTINDPMDKRSWSGITYYLGHSLKKHVGDVHFLGPVKIPWLLDKIFRAAQKLTRIFFKTEWLPKYSLLKNVYAAYILKKKMRGHSYDFVLAPAAASELAYLSIDLPIIYFGDATFKIYSESYIKEFSNLSLYSKWEGEHLEKRSLKKSDLVILTSQWAADSAINDYHIPVNKIEILLLGANIDYTPDPSVIYDKELNKTLTLLFLAVDWERKGGNIAFEILQHLNSSGIKTKLIICGCTPPPEYEHPDVEVIPFINKNIASEYERFVKLLSAVHFLVLPTRADCSLLVAMEANSYGVPAITTCIGGVPDVVENGVNGYCLPLDAGPEIYAQTIADLFLDKMRYRKIITSSRKRFEEVLNWDQWAQRFRALLKKHNL